MKINIMPLTKAKVNLKELINMTFTQESGENLVLTIALLQIFGGLFAGDLKHMIFYVVYGVIYLSIFHLWKKHEELCDQMANCMSSAYLIIPALLLTQIFIFLVAFTS